MQNLDSKFMIFFYVFFIKFILIYSILKEQTYDSLLDIAMKHKVLLSLSIPAS